MGQPSMMRTMRLRARCTSRPGAWKIPHRSAFGLASRQVPSKQRSWNHRTRSADKATAQPVGVVFEAREGEPVETGVLQATDVLFDVGMGAHHDVELAGVSVLVGVEAPVAVLEGGEEAALGAGMERLASDDEPGAVGELRIVDERGELGDCAPVLRLPVLSEGRQPDLLDPDGVEDRRRHLGIAPRRDEEPDVAGPAGGQEASVQPAESARTTTSRWTRSGSSPTW